MNRFEDLQWDDATQTARATVKGTEVELFYAVQVSMTDDDPHREVSVVSINGRKNLATIGDYKHAHRFSDPEIDAVLTVEDYEHIVRVIETEDRGI